MKQDKRIQRILSTPSDYTFMEASTLLSQLGYVLDNKGSTSGSRVCFYREADKAVILLHKPHPGDIMRQYAVKQLVRTLRERGDIDG